MKTRIALTLGSALVACVAPAHAQTEMAQDSLAELNALVARIQTKISSGKNTPADLTPEKADFNTLRARSAGQKSEVLGKILHFGYTFHQDILKDEPGALALRKELEKNHRKYVATTSLVREWELADRSAKEKKAHAALIGKRAPELNFMWSNRKGLTRLSSLRGKVVVLDFWATWCGPCIATFPQIRELAEHYKDADVVVLGVTSVQGYVSGLGPSRIVTRGDPDHEFALTADFIKAKQMTWPVVFTEERVFNPAYGVTGIPHMAIIAPDGTVRHNGLHPAMSHAEKLQKIDQLLAEFGKTKTPRSTSE